MSALAEDAELQLETMLTDGDEGSERRLLLIVNPYATTVSDRLRELVIGALRGRYQLDAIATERRDHATELTREAAAEGYDAVVAFGGDGTINEVANGLVGSQTPLTCLPGGRANVYCRMLGIPPDVIEATEHLLALADVWRPRSVDLGRIQDRYFLFSAGVGLDADVVRAVDSHPRLKARLGEYYYAWVASTTYARRYLLRPPRFTAQIGSGDPVGGVAALIQNSSPYTYFGNRGIEMASGAGLHSGDLSALVLQRTSPFDIPSVAWRALSAHARVIDHRQIRSFTGQTSLRIRSVGDHELPIQVDGDFIGTARALDISVAPGALKIVS